MIPNDPSSVRRLPGTIALALAILLCVLSALPDPAGRPPLNMVLLWSLAAVLLAAGAGLPEPGPMEPPGQTSLSPPFAGWATFLGCLLGILLIVLSLERFGASDSVSRDGWLLFLLAHLLVTLSFFPWKGLPTGSGQKVTGREVAALALVVLVAAALLAISRWHVTSSRFGMAILFPTLVIPLVLFLYVRSQRLRSPRDAALAGTSLGLGVQLYYSIVTLPAVIVLTFLRGLLPAPRRRLAAAVALLAVTLGLAVLAYAPVWQFARHHSEHFAERFRAVSGLEVDSIGQLLRLFLAPSPERQKTIEGLSTSFARHARMFLFRADANGRHNLPGAPMLDTVSGFFFAVGLLWCIGTLGQSRSLLLLLWFCSSMAAGILSVDFEAPQAARTLGVTPALSLMASLPLSHIWLIGRGDVGAVDARRARPRDALPGCRRMAGLGDVLPQAALRSGSLGLLVDSGNEVGRGHPQRRAGGRYFAPPPMIESPIIRLLLGRPNPARPFEVSRDVPLETSERRAVVFLGEDELEAQTLLQKLYANATPEALRDWSVLDVRPPLTARARGRLKVGRFGTYRLVLLSAASAALSVDGVSVLSGTGRKKAMVPLAEGIHDLALDVKVLTAAGYTELRWADSASGDERPIPPSAMYSSRFPFGGLLGSYYTVKTCEGAPVFQRIDPRVAFYFHLISLERPFSICWSGKIEALEDGLYTFSMRSIDESFVRLDGTEVVRNPGTLQETEGARMLSRGWHALDVRFWNTSDYAQAYLPWIRPGRERELIPAEVLRPSPSTPERERRTQPNPPILR